MILTGILGIGSEILPTNNVNKPLSSRRLSRVLDSKLSPNDEDIDAHFYRQNALRSFPNPPNLQFLPNASIYHPTKQHGTDRKSALCQNLISLCTSSNTKQKSTYKCMMYIPYSPNLWNSESLTDSYTHIYIYMRIRVHSRYSYNF